MVERHNLTGQSISYGHGFLYDGDRLVGGVEGAWTASGAGASQALSEGDFLALTRAGADASTTHGTALSLSTTTYTKARFRYKCSNSNVKAGILVTFSSGTQTILAATNSTTLTPVVVTLTAGKTITGITLYATAAAGTVYYDFLLIYKNDFAIPHSTQIDFIPTPRYAHHKTFGMIGEQTHNGGSEPAEWHLNADLTIGTWKRVGDALAGEVFLDIVHNSATEPWQWFNSELGQCKVTVDMPNYHRAASGQSLDWALACTLREKRISSAGCSHETYTSRFHLDLI